MEGTPAVPLHFLDEMEEPESVEPVEMEEPVDIHTQNVDKVVLPNEAKLIQHFASLYSEFQDALSDHLPTEPFTTDQRIRLFGIYARTWGQGHV